MIERLVSHIRFFCVIVRSAVRLLVLIIIIVMLLLLIIIGVLLLIMFFLDLNLKGFLFFKNVLRLILLLNMLVWCVSGVLVGEQSHDLNMLVWCVSGC
jgi:hypothetical protein